MITKLSIDTSDVDTTKISILLDDDVFEKKSSSRMFRSQMVLPLIEELLAEHNQTMRDIRSIQVASGPGSFTGLRVGVTIANALGFLLDIPVNGQKTLVNPTY